MAIVLVQDQVDVSEFFPNAEDQTLAAKILRKFRRQIGDDNKLANILNGLEYSFTDKQIYGFIEDTIDDINSGYPRTGYTLTSLADNALVTFGAISMALRAAGVLEMKNSLAFNDQGLSINTYDKGPNYSAAADSFTRPYEQGKMNLKAAEQFRNLFATVSSDFGAGW